jgi:hypothetical protein
MNKDFYIENSVKFRMGKWFSQPFLPKPCDWNDSVIVRKNLQYKCWIERWKKYGISINPGIYLDSQDSYVNKQEIKDSPIAVYNRRASVQDGILFPIERNPTKDLFKPFNDSYQWADKKSDVIWRGQLSGISKCITDPIENDGPVNLWDNLENDFLKCLRMNFVYKFGKDYNIKFSEIKTSKEWYSKRKRPPKNAEKNEIFLKKLIFENEYLIGVNVPFDEQLKYKYILDLDGNNSPGSTISIMKSNSLMIRPEPKWHTVIFFNLKPWEHYVPLKYDGSDFEQKLDWCKSNDDECAKISKRANKHISQFDKGSEEEIEKLIFKRLQKNKK